MPPRLPSPAAPMPNPGVDVGDQIYFQHTDGPRHGRVVAHGKHGCTVDCAGERHKVAWERVLGHRERAQHALRLLDQGEDGAIVERQDGRRQFVRINPESRMDTEEDSLTKALRGAEALIKKMGAGGKIANRPGLVLRDEVDKTGKHTKRWERANDAAPAAKPRAGAPAGAAAPPPKEGQPDAKFGAHNVQEGHHIRFKAGAVEGRGHVTARGQHGVTVRDETGREHGVRWNEIQSHVPASADGPLFHPEEVEHLPDMAKQPFDSWEKISAAAPKALEEYHEALGRVAKLMGLRADKKPEEMTPDDLTSNDGFLFVGPIKSQERSTAKVENDYDGDWSLLRDVVRATIAVKDMESVRSALEEVKKTGLEVAQKPKDRFAKPTPEGYRDLMLIVKLPSGMVAEMQIHVKSMTSAKEKAHGLYAKAAAIERKYPPKSSPDTFDPEDRETYLALRKQQQAIYNPAWEAAKKAVAYLKKSMVYPMILLLGSIGV